MVRDYGYYKQLLVKIKNKEELPLDRINLSGSRMSSKTFSSIDFFILACLLAKCKVEMFRYWNDDKSELYDQVIANIRVYPGLYEQLEYNLTRKEIKFPNGSAIRIRGLHKQKNDEVKLTGMAGSTDFEYGFAYAEERYEISDIEWSAVQQAIRGYKNYMEVHAANPWIFSNDYTKYLHGQFPFDLKRLKKNGQQFKVIGRELYHYTNYQINHFLEEADKRKLKMAGKFDPHRANTILYGYPGSPAGAIWRHFLDKMFREQDWEDANKYVGCVDYGEKGDASTGYIIGYSPQYRHAHVQHEYYWANKPDKEFKDTKALAHETAMHFMDFFDEHNLSQELDVFVDGAAIPFITALNNVVDEYGYSSAIGFYQSKKYKVAERIEQVKALAAFGMLTIDANCPNARREYQEATYSKKTSEYRDGDDHAQDAIEYGLAAQWVELLDNLELVQEEELLKEA